MRILVALPTVGLLPACLLDYPQADDPPPGYHSHVEPLLERSCFRCHHDEGSAPSFEDPAVPLSLAPRIAALVAEGHMPPPAPDPTCRDYAGAESLSLSEPEKALIARWVAAGAPEGDPLPWHRPWEPDTTAPFDAELRGDAPYTPVFGATGNDYRCFPLALGSRDPAYVTGFEALVDEPRLVHHVVLWQVSPAWEAPASGDGAPGFACGGFGEAGWSFFTGWAPGGRPVTLPDGMGMQVEADARFVLQVHYYDGGDGPLPDRSGFGLHLAPSVDTVVWQAPLGVEGFVVPAGDADHTETMLLPWAWGSVALLGVFPHMHVLGTGFDFTVHRGGGGETCVTRMDDWDFHNQQAVLLREPVIVEEGDVIEVTCRWDNSAANPEQPADPPADVPFGEETGEEMCYAFTYAFVP